MRGRSWKSEDIPLQKPETTSVSDEKSGIHQEGFFGRSTFPWIRCQDIDQPQSAQGDLYGRPALQARLAADRLKLNVPREKGGRFVNGKGWGDYDAFRPRLSALTLAVTSKLSWPTTLNGKAHEITMRLPMM